MKFCAVGLISVVVWFFLQKPVVRVCSAVMPHKPLIPWDAAAVSSMPEKVNYSDIRRTENSILTDVFTGVILVGDRVF